MQQFSQLPINQQEKLRDYFQQVFTRVGLANKFRVEIQSNNLVIRASTTTSPTDEEEEKLSEAMKAFNRGGVLKCGDSEIWCQDVSGNLQRVFAIRITEVELTRLSDIFNIDSEVTALLTERLNPSANSPQLPGQAPLPHIAPQYGGAAPHPQQIGHNLAIHHMLWHYPVPAQDNKIPVAGIPDSVKDQLRVVKDKKVQDGEILKRWDGFSAQLQQHIIDCLQEEMSKRYDKLKTRSDLGDTYISPISYDAPTIPVRLPSSQKKGPQCTYDLNEVLQFNTKSQGRRKYRLREDPLTREWFDIGDILPAADALKELKNRALKNSPGGNVLYRSLSSKS